MQAPSDPPSPCIGVCAVARDTGLCIGCLRTTEEIANWTLFEAAGKRRVLEAVKARKEAGEGPSPDYEQLWR